MNKRIISFSVLIFLCLIMVMPLFGQPPDPPDPTVPIDGGAGFLLAAGLIYGLHRYRKSRKS
jgi:hypothetical protein